VRISKLITWNWGSVDNREWLFGDTVLLTGESGSGKSTLLDSIQTLLTAAHHHLVQFNIGQDESTQSRRGGKEPRTLPAYALGQQADGVFLRNRSTSYVALVFDSTESAGELEQPFTVVIGVEAHEDGGKAVLTRNPLFFVVRRPLSLSHFTQDGTAAVGQRTAAVALKDIYLVLQSKLRAGSEVVQRFEDKTSYLTHVYGALMGKTQVNEAEAHRAAKSLVRAMAYKELGNVNDLVRDEILDPRDFSKDLSTMRTLMKTIAALNEDAVRLKENIERLNAVEEAASQVVSETRRFVVTTMAHAVRAVDDAEGEKTAAERGIDLQTRRNKLLEERLKSLDGEEEQYRNSLNGVLSELATNDVANRQQFLQLTIRNLTTQFDRDWGHFHKAAKALGGVFPALDVLLALDVSELPGLQQALDKVRPTVRTLARYWSGGLSEMAALTAGLGTSLPAFDVEAFDKLLVTLDGGLRVDEDSVAAATVDALSTVKQNIATLDDQYAQRTSELTMLQAGKPPAHPDVYIALSLLEREAPDAKPNILSSLVNPIKGSTWQNAIEGYLGADRFALIVEPGHEAYCTRLVKRRFPKRSPKVAQGSKAIEDTRSFRPEARSIVNELEVTHPVAKAFLHALYGRTRKVETEDELSRTGAGLMEEGIGSRAYGMFACRVDDNELAFGEANRKARMAWCQAELGRIRTARLKAEDTSRSLRAVSASISGVALTPLAPLLEPVLSGQRQHFDAEQELASLDTSSVQSLLERKAELEGKLLDVKERCKAETLAMGGNNEELKRHRKALAHAEDKLPGLRLDVTNSYVWATRYVAGATELAAEQQLIDEAQTLSDTDNVQLATLKTRADGIVTALPGLLRDVNSAVYIYMKGARTDDERFIYQDPPRGIDKLEHILKSMLGLLQVVRDQARRQNSNGLAENQRSLEDAEHRFNNVFTTNFCFKVRDEIRQGATTLQRLNRELKNIQFGYDTYELEWAWVPRLQKVYEFFEAAEALADTFEKEKGSIFDSSHLSDEHRETAKSIKDLLLADDLGASERHLKEMADYRNYRRYDIIRRNKAGTTRLSTWGTGSGGELETPFYVIRSAVLAHALGHFGRDRKGAPALRLMLSDEAFSKMDESRSRSVLQFLSKTLGLQLVVAMPTSKSGAVKPEFDKEFTFSKVLASRDGNELYVSEVQEKTLKREPMQRLWAEHAIRAREAGRVSYETQNAAKLRLVAGTEVADSANEAGDADADGSNAVDAAGKQSGT
jgi:energy-coupling factor transporter ATP-binding protein EcfA2